MAHEPRWPTNAELDEKSKRGILDHSLDDVSIYDLLAAERDAKVVEPPRGSVDNAERSRLVFRQRSSDVWSFTLTTVISSMALVRSAVTGH